jgi:hypothetical protein
MTWWLDREDQDQEDKEYPRLQYLRRYLIYRGIEVPPVKRETVLETDYERILPLLNTNKQGDEAESAGGKIKEVLKSWKPKPKPMIVVLDTSSFMSSESLQDLIEVLKSLKEKVKDDNLKILVPSLLDSGLGYVENEDEFSSIERLKEIFSTWLNPDGEEREHAEYIIKGLLSNSHYKKLLKEFRSSFSLQKAKDFISSAETQLRDRQVLNFITREEIIKKLPPKDEKYYAADVLHEIVFTSAKLGAGIVNFGNRLRNIMARFGKKVMEIRSQFKEEIKSQAKVKLALKISIVVISIAATGAILSSTHGMADAWGEIPKEGMAEGLVFLILNG